MEDSSNSSPPKPILISPESLPEDTLQAVLESFVLREGTDYGRHELTLEEKVHNLKRRWDRDEIVLVFDTETESLTFITKDESRRCL